MARDGCACDEGWACTVDIASWGGVPGVSCDDHVTHVLRTPCSRGRARCICEGRGAVRGVEGRCDDAGRWIEGADRTSVWGVRGVGRTRSSVSTLNDDRTCSDDPAVTS